MDRLSAGTIAQLPDSVTRPGYGPDSAAVGVVHLGVGNFFRAHQAAYLDEAMSNGASGWGVCGVSLRSPDTRDALLPQDGYYTLIESDGGPLRARVVGSLRELLVAPERPQAVVDRIAAPATRWVTLTITEKGYGHTGATAEAGAAARLDDKHADIAHDLADPGQPRSAVGLIHAALLQRRRERLGGLTILSCDNLSRNGDLLRDLLLAFDQRRGTGAHEWIANEVCLPNTMIDRIVPRTDAAQRSLAQQLLGVTDAWPVITEPFRQWVIEDRLRGPRPPLERSGVQWVTDVGPYEAMKLRLLNAAHSALAWLSVPAGIVTVDQAIATPGWRDFIEALWREEIIPGLDPDVMPIAPAYCDRLLARFANPGLAHLTVQIAMDGSQKLPLRILSSIRVNLVRNLPIDRLSLVVAAWIRYLEGADEAGRPYPPDDPLATRLQPLARMPEAAAAVQGLLAQRGIFGDLAASPVLASRTTRWLERLRERGGRNVLVIGRPDDAP